MFLLPNHMVFVHEVPLSRRRYSSYILLGNAPSQALALGCYKVGFLSAAVRHV